MKRRKSLFQLGSYSGECLEIENKYVLTLGKQIQRLNIMKKMQQYNGIRVIERMRCFHLGGLWISDIWIEPCLIKKKEQHTDLQEDSSR